MSANPWCERLGIPVPDLDAIVGTAKKLKLFYLMVVALVERGGPMPTAEIADRLRQAGVPEVMIDGGLERALVKSWHGSEPVYRLPDGRFGLDLESDDLDLILYVTGVRPAGTESRLIAKAAEAPFVEPRRAVVHAISLDETPQALVILDVGAHTMTTLVGESVSESGAYLEKYDLLVGLGVRRTLQGLGLSQDDWRIVDLASAPKSIRLNRQGRTLRVTPEMLIRSTTGISKPLGDSRKMRQYVAKGEVTKLRRRLESDVKALNAFYRYGILHDYVRLHWGFLDNLVPVNWRLQGEPDVIDILRAAAEAGTPVDLVTGSAPGWAEPWARARRGQVIGLSAEAVQLSWGNEVWPVYRFDIQAVRTIESQRHFLAR